MSPPAGPSPAAAMLCSVRCSVWLFLAAKAAAQRIKQSVQIKAANYNPELSGPQLIWRGRAHYRPN